AVGYEYGSQGMRRLRELRGGRPDGSDTHGFQYEASDSQPGRVRRMLRLLPRDERRASQPGDGADESKDRKLVAMAIRSRTGRLPHGGHHRTGVGLATRRAPRVL